MKEDKFPNSVAGEKDDAKVTGVEPTAVFENKMNQPTDLEHKKKINITLKATWTSWEWN